MKKIFRNSFLFFSILFCIISFLKKNFYILNFNERNISINYNDRSYILPIGSSFRDLKRIINIQNFDISDEYILSNKEVITTNENNKVKISINNANINELISLPGIGEKTALKIIEYREKYGKYLSIEDIKNVSGIGDKKYEKIKEFISI